MASYTQEEHVKAGLKASKDAFESALYPPIEPYKTEMLSVSPIHTLYVEQSGNPTGQPVVFLHGGPGGGCGDSDRRYFDPKAYRIVTFDQRGAGKSTPSASLEDNTTWHLVDDIEKIRNHLQIDKWVVFGGSWGSTLSLAYAQKHPQKVKALVLRGIFLVRRAELEFFYQGPGSSFLFPDYWDAYEAAIPPEERDDMMKAYYKRLIGTDEDARASAAAAWAKWELATSKLLVDPEYIARADEPGFANAFARIECHYFNHGCWLEDGQLIAKDNIDKIRSIPTTIVQGRYDVVCPIRSAWDLYKVFPEAKLTVIADAGHSAKEAGIAEELIKATDSFREL